MWIETKVDSVIWGYILEWIQLFVDNTKWGLVLLWIHFVVDSKKCAYRKSGLGKRVDWTICGLKQKWIQ